MGSLASEDVNKPLAVVHFCSPQAHRRQGYPQRKLCSTNSSREKLPRTPFLLTRRTAFPPTQSGQTTGEGRVVLSPAPQNYPTEKRKKESCGGKWPIPIPTIPCFCDIDNTALLLYSVTHYERCPFCAYLPRRSNHSDGVFL